MDQGRWSNRVVAAARARHDAARRLLVAVAVVLLLVCMALMAPDGTLSPDGTAEGATPTPSVEEVGVRRADRRPNIVVVNTDDMRASDLDVMTSVTERIAPEGVTFGNSVVTTAACCPSRATHLTGQYAHNTGVLHNLPPFGGYPAFRDGRQRAGETLPIWMQQAGYRTVFIGKFMNHYPGKRAKYHVPDGFTDWYGLFEGTARGRKFDIYRQTRYAVRVRPQDGEAPALDVAHARAVFPAPSGGGHVFVYDGKDSHQTEVLMDGAIEVVRRYGDSEPLYLNVWLTAPHTGGDAPAVGGGRYGKKDRRPYTTRPAEPELDDLRRRLREGDGLGPYALDRGESFNEADVDDKPAFVAEQPKLRRREIRDLEIRHALRVASLRSIDRKLEELLTAIEQAQQRTGRDTYVIFTSDNGYFLGEHRMPFEKNWHYGAATNVPLVIRGPGVAAGAEVDAVAANVDLAPTILDMADAADHASGQVDGRSLLPLLQAPETGAQPEWADRAVLLEGWWGGSKLRRYAAVRTASHVYVEHYGRRGRTVRFRELYDLTVDPDHGENLLHGDVAPGDRALAARLAAVLRRLRDCEGAGCAQTVSLADAPDATASAPPAGARATPPVRSPWHDR